METEQMVTYRQVAKKLDIDNKKRTKVVLDRERDQT